MYNMLLEIEDWQKRIVIDSSRHMAMEGYSVEDVTAWAEQYAYSIWGLDPDDVTEYATMGYYDGAGSAQGVVDDDWRYL